MRLESISDSPVEKLFPPRYSSSNPVSCDKLAKQNNKNTQYVVSLCDIINSWRKVLHYVIDFK